MSMAAMASPDTAPIAILGATSQMARDFILDSDRTVPFALYARDPARVCEFLASHGLPSVWRRGALADLVRDADRGERFAGIVNFVGVGDPARASALGGGIFEATATSDAVARAASAHDPSTPYVFLSSGAVYGDGFETPASADKPATFRINPVAPSSYYAMAKCHAEAVHRSCSGRTIIDLRVFNYISRNQDIASRYFLTDMVRAILDDAVFETADDPMVRDFLNPKGFGDLLRACLAAPAGTNQPIDAYSAAPISKQEMLALMADAFGLRYRMVERTDAISATGAKRNYYSEFKAAHAFGYVPRYSSADAIRVEVAAMLAMHRTVVSGR